MNKRIYFTKEEKLASRREHRKQKPPEWHQNQLRLSKESRLRYPERCNERARLYRLNHMVNGVSKEKQYCIDNPEKYLWWAARNRAKINNIEFSIDQSDIIIPTHCPILGVELIPVRQTKSNRDRVPSVDRVDNSQGYIKGNIRVISFKANRYKTDMSIENIENLLLYSKGLL